MKYIYALSYQEFIRVMNTDNVLHDDNIDRRPVAIIEIMGEQDSLIHPFHFKRDHPNVIRLLFDDVDERLDIKLLGDVEDGREYVPVVPMSEEQGKEIVDFIKLNRDKSYFLVHCAAGISRSAAVAEWISDFLGEDNQLFKSRNPLINPNRRIYNILTAISKYFKDETL